MYERKKGKKTNTSIQQRSRQTLSQPPKKSPKKYSRKIARNTNTSVMREPSERKTATPKRSRPSLSQKKGGKNKQL